MTFYRVMDVDDLQDGQMKVVEIAGYEYLVARVGGRYFAVDNFCTHEGGNLHEGHLDGDRVVCPRHRGSFHLASGEVASPPPEFPLETYPIKVEGRDVMLDIKF